MALTKDLREFSEWLNSNEVVRLAQAGEAGGLEFEAVDAGAFVVGGGVVRDAEEDLVLVGNGEIPQPRVQHF